MGRTTVLKWLDDLEVATFREAVKMGKCELGAKHLHHACYIAADLCLLCVKFSGRNVDIESDFVGGQRLGCRATWAANKN